MSKESIKMTPGDDTHLTLLMAPVSLNLVTGQDREHLLAYGRAAFEAGQKCQGCDVPKDGVYQISEPSHSMSQYASKDDMLKAVMAENEQLRAQLAAVQQGVQPEGECSATYGMNIAQRILHVGGRENAQTYIEFGSVEAVRMLVAQVLRDLPNGYPDFCSPTTHPTPQGLDADMFWDADDPERCESSINNVVVEAYSYRGLKVGDIVTIQRAARLPGLEVRVTQVPDGEGNGDLEWDVIDAAQAKQGGA